MKRTLSISLLISFFVLSTSFDYSGKEAMDILKQNCPDSYYVVNMLTLIPESYGSSLSKRDGISHWLSTSNPVHYLASFSTGVHECYHGYNSSGGKYHLDQANKKTNPDDEYFCYYINKDEKHIVKKTEVFPSAEMAKQFTLSLKMERFSTYISPSSENQSTQLDGIYALLDEWNAYYLGTKTLLELIPYAKKNIELNAENWGEYLYNLNSDYFAYIEFKVYIINYLLYAKTYHPEMYQGIIANKDFMKAYFAVDRAYSAQVQKYFSEKKSLLEYLNNNGVQVTEDETSIFFGTDGIGNFVFKYNKMIAELAKDKYKGVFADLEHDSTD